jgi:cation transport ATPase
MIKLDLQLKPPHKGHKMEKADKPKSALSSASSYLKEKSPIVIAAAGFLFYVIGFTSIPMFSFSLEAAIEVLTGGVLIILAFLIHSRSYFSGTTQEKAYALSITSLIALLTIGIILYSFANAELVFVANTVVSTGGPAGEKFPTYTVVANHIYQQFAAYAFGFTIVLAVFAVYLRSKID